MVAKEMYNICTAKKAPGIKVSINLKTQILCPLSCVNRFIKKYEKGEQFLLIVCPYIALLIVIQKSRFIVNINLVK